MIFKDGKNYDRFKYFVRYVLPALIALVASTSAIWNIEFSREIATLTELQIFLMVFVSMSKERYYKEEERLEKEWKKQYEEEEEEK